MMLEPFSVPIVDVTGRVRRIRSLPLCDREWFASTQFALRSRVEGQDFRVLYDSDPLFKTLVDECLLLHGISPGWVDIYMTSRLLFGMGDEPAILLQLNFPPDTEPPDKDARPIPETIDPTAYHIASLWGATENLEQSFKIAREQPWQEVQAVLKARSHQLKEVDADAKAKAKEEERLENSRQKMEELKESGKLGELLNVLARNGNDGAVKLEQLPDDYLP